jgi:arsenate reductase
MFEYVVTVCDKEAAEKCPVFPGIAQALHWSFPDPSALTGSEEEKLKRTREIRDAIKAQVRTWVATRPPAR